MLNNFFNKDKKLNTENNSWLFDDVNNEPLSDVEFYVNEKKRTVACKLCNCEHIAINRIYKYTDNTIEWLTRPDRYLIDDVYMAVAKCSPEDDFNIEYGKKVALIKAKALRGKAINDALLKFSREITKSIETLNEYGMHKIPNLKAFLDGEDE